MRVKISNAKTVEEFTTAIEKMVKNGCDYLDAILTYCEQNNVEIETAAALVRNSPTLKAHIKEIAEKLNLMK